MQYFHYGARGRDVERRPCFAQEERSELNMGINLVEGRIDTVGESYSIQRWKRYKFCLYRMYDTRTILYCTSVDNIFVNFFLTIGRSPSQFIFFKFLCIRDKIRDALDADDSRGRE